VKGPLAPALVLATASLAFASGSTAPDVRPTALRDVGFDQRIGETVPLEARFRDEAGRSVALGDYFGRKPVVMVLAYYECPMLCTLSLNGLASALKVLTFDAGREFEVVTVSFEPKETPELAAAKKAAYLKGYGRPGAESGWHFLTGEAGSVAALTRAVGFRYAWDEETRQYAHPAGVLVLTPEGRIARYLFGVEYSPRDLRFALVEASAGRLGSVVDDVVLFCYRYDPTRGRYGAAVMRLTRVAGALTLAALGAFLFGSLRRDRAVARSGGGR
jgi:protein SCO1/2